MAITSISHKVSNTWILRLVDAEKGSHVDFPLLENYAPASLDLATEGVVHESHKYRALLITDAILGDGDIMWSLNGEEPIALQVRAVANYAEDINGIQLSLYQLILDRDDGWYPFSMTYGFASISLRLCLTESKTESFSTKDIPCMCDREDQEVSVLGIIDTLVSGADEEAVRWMFGFDQVEEDRLALMESGLASDSSKSLSSFLALCEKTVRGYEANLNYFCTHAHCRTVKTSVLVSPSQVRSLGRSELLWLAGNPEVLREVPAETPLRMNGSYVIPSHLRTDHPRKTFDIRENRALLSFAEAVAAALSRILDRAQDDIDHIESMVSQLQGMEDGDGLILALVMLEASLNRERPLCPKSRRSSEANA